MKTVIIIGDGIADRPLKELNYLTPLEAAGLKSMDRRVSRYNERAAYRGGLGHMHGRHIMPISLDLMGNVEKFGA